MTKLDISWVSDLRDCFIEDGKYVISQGVLWTHNPATQLWDASSIDEMPRLAASYLDANDFERPGSKDWVSVINNTSNRKELVQALWTHNHLWDTKFFSKAPPGLAVGPDFIQVDKKSISAIPLTAEHRARHSLDFKLPTKDLGSLDDPKHYVAALERMFGRNVDGAEKVAAFQEFLGACRTGIVTAYERCIIMPGGGSNGKSTIIMGGAESIFSKHERRSITPNFLNQEYYLMQMRDAAINYVTELPKERINCTERFKQIISGEPVTGRPIREMPVTFQPIAGHIYACNNFPQLSDNSKGMWRRLMVLRSDANFAKNDGLRADLVNSFKAEAPQILAWALRGAQRLMVKGDYTIPPSHFVEESQWRGSNDKSLQFVRNCTKGFGSGWTKASVALKYFRTWFEGQGFNYQERQDAGQFGAALAHLEGFQSKRQSYGMAYNFVIKPPEQWSDYSHGGDHGMGEVQLEASDENV
jgi:phage/plasmid-associated DNA primase